MLIWRLLLFFRQWYHQIMPILSDIAAKMQPSLLRQDRTGTLKA